MNRDSTLGFYDRNAESTAANYEQISFDRLAAELLPYLPVSGRLLELGVGSGRDAARWLAHGMDVTGLDGSEAMIAEALRWHPELSGRLVHHVLPHALPFADAVFDVVTSMAVIMHLARADLSMLFADVVRVLVPGGMLVYSVNTARSGLDGHGYDSRGRHFTCLSVGQWEELHVSAGLQTVLAKESEDITGRSGIRWVAFVARKAIAI